MPITRKATQVRPARTVTLGAVAQQKILQAVDELFYGEGAHAVSVDAVVRKAGVNKMAVYRQFASKEALLLHYLERMDEVFWGHFDRSVAQHPDDPRMQLVQFFVDLAARSQHAGFRGCPFVNAAIEFPDASHTARGMVAGTKARLLHRLMDIATQAGAVDPVLLGKGLLLLIEGAYAASQTLVPSQPVMMAMPDIARAMVDGACTPRAVDASAPRGSGPGPKRG